MFKQRYYWNLNTFSLCRLALISGNLKCEYVEAVEIVRTTILSELTNLILCRPVLLSGNLQSEHVAVVQKFQTTILSEPYLFKPL